MTYREMYNMGISRLEAAGIDEAKLDARLLLEFVCNTNQNTLLLYGNEARSDEELADYISAIERREKHIPLQHITNTQEFMGLEFYVNENVLVPRQDTEILIEECMKNMKDGMKILDMCTGSGCILLSLLHFGKNCEGLGADLSKKALEVSEINAKKLGGNAKFIHSDLFENVEDKFDMIVSNPPYIETKEIENLMPEVKNYEPMMALDGMEDGLFFYRKIVDESRKHLYDGAGLFFEIGYNQGQAVKELMEQAGFVEVKIVKDYAGLDRVVSGFYKAKKG